MWAYAKGDKVKHCYISLGPECYRACDPTSSQIRTLSKGGNKAKCKGCKKVIGDQ